MYWLLHRKIWGQRIARPVRRSRRMNISPPSLDVFPVRNWLQQPTGDMSPFTVAKTAGSRKTTFDLVVT